MEIEDVVIEVHEAPIEVEDVLIAFDGDVMEPHEAVMEPHDPVMDLHDVRTLDPASRTYGMRLSRTYATPQRNEKSTNRDGKSALVVSSYP
jgi:hypothetical protein